MNGRDYVVTSEIKELSVCVWAHRLVFSTGLVSKGSREQAVNAAFAQVEVPTEEWTK